MSIVQMNVFILLICCNLFPLHLSYTTHGRINNNGTPSSTTTTMSPTWNNLSEWSIDSYQSLTSLRSDNHLLTDEESNRHNATIIINYYQILNQPETISWFEKPWRVLGSATSLITNFFQKLFN
ncbi:unnamed protein product [Adineta steineri]|uniref:Uncharacterized protein n=1 Tax=Adineta steineri TaxID=433720 RepID=A0A819VLX9_9BILA|nr:unnamed protein product [Adineta steineri]CAF4110888.1 unnamed protein product [Adineta steineri]